MCAEFNPNVSQSQQSPSTGQYIAIGKKTETEKVRILGTDNKQLRATAKQISDFLNSENAPIDLSTADEAKLNRIQTYLDTGTTKIAKKAEQFVDRHLGSAPSPVKSIAISVVNFILEKRSQYKNADGISDFFKAKSDTVHYKEASAKIQAVKDFAQNTKSINATFNNPEKIHKILTSPGFINDANEINNILLSTKLNDVEKLDRYHEKYNELIIKYVNKNLAKVAPDDLNPLNFAIMSVGKDQFNEIEKLINKFTENWDELTGTSDLPSDQELRTSGLRQAVIIRLETSLALFNKVYSNSESQ